MKKSLRRLLLIGFVITIVVSAVLAGGCNSVDEYETECGICGKYARQENPEIYLIINNDGTFIHKSPEPWGVTCMLTGNWVFEGDTLLLVWPSCNYRVELYIQGNTIIYNADDGSFAYTKQDEQ
jgi:hypothetical protein